MRTDFQPRYQNAALPVTADIAHGLPERPMDPIAAQRVPKRCLMFVIEALTVGGAERMVIDIANALASRGEEIHVVCLTAPGELSTGLDASVHFHVLDKRPGIDLSILGKIRRLAISLRVDVVNSHLWTANTWTRLALIKTGISVVITEHNRDIWKKVYHRAIDRVLSHAMSRLVAVSEDTASFYRLDVGVSPSKVCVVNNGVDTLHFAGGNGTSLRGVLAESHEILIGTVGRLAEAKNHKRLVDAAVQLRQRDFPVKVVIAGDGPLKGEISDYIAQQQAEHFVSLLGTRSDIPDLLAALDVFVLSSDREGHPLSALEAQAAGTPVVLTDAGGSADAVSRDGHNCGGMLVDRSSIALAAGIQELLLNPNRLEAMAIFAQRFALDRFDKSDMVDQYSAIFDDCLATR